MHLLTRGKVCTLQLCEEVLQEMSKSVNAVFAQLFAVIKQLYRQCVSVKKLWKAVIPATQAHQAAPFFLRSIKIFQIMRLHYKKIIFKTKQLILVVHEPKSVWQFVFFQHFIVVYNSFSGTFEQLHCWN